MDAGRCPSEPYEVTRFEKKIQTKLAQVWGENENTWRVVEVKMKPHDCAAP